jgi:hypothetical protein
MVRKALFYMLFINLVIMSAGCATVPKESVELSTLVGEMIASAKVSHVNMVNRHFYYIRAEVEYFAFHDYKKAFLNNIRKVAKEKDPNFTELTLDQYDQVISRIQKKRDQWLNEVEKNRQSVLQALEEHYVVLSQSNAVLTSMLRSAVRITETRTALLERFGPKVGISGTKIKEVEDKVLETTNNIRTIMADALKALQQ